MSVKQLESAISALPPNERREIINWLDDHRHELIAPVDEISPDLVVKSTLENEGTTKYSCFKLKEGFQSLMQVGLHTYKHGVLGVHLFDTRGQIRLNKNEEAEIDIMLEVI